MLKLFATEVIISKGYDNAPALRFSEKGDSVRFRIGARVYDTRAKDQTRWVNLGAKAFGPVCERVKRMQLKEGSRINLVGRLDEDVWEDARTHERKSASVIILDDLEYCYTGTGEKKPGDGQRAAAGPQASASPSAAGDMPAGFTGFEAYGAFGGGGLFFDE